MRLGIVKQRTMEKNFKRKINSLSAVFNFLESFFKKNDIDNDTSFALSLAAEEIFTNLVKYNHPNPNPIRLNLIKTTDRITACFSDFEVEPFDITRTHSPDHHLPLRERSPGGIGLNLVKKMIDELSYEYDHKKRECHITLTKYLGEGHVRDQHRQ